jgi:hypothetical protein
MSARWRRALGSAALAVAASRAAATPPCEGELPGLATALHGVEVALFGEIHGTVEMPALFARAVCAVAARGPVTAALELPESNQRAIDELLARGREAIAPLLEAPPWSAPQAEQYGLTSGAMLDLLLELRRLRAAGLPIAVAAFDRRPTQGGNDETLADALAELARAEPRRPVLALIGNLHARVGVGAPWNPAQRFAGTLLRDRGLAVLGLYLAHAGGSAWVCIEGEGCGERTMSAGRDRSPPPGAVELGDVPTFPGLYDGRIAVGEIRASPPARAAAGSAPRSSDVRPVTRP